MVEESRLNQYLFAPVTSTKVVSCSGIELHGAVAMIDVDVIGWPA